MLDWCKMGIGLNKCSCGGKVGGLGKGWRPKEPIVTCCLQGAVAMCGGWACSCWVRVSTWCRNCCSCNWSLRSCTSASSMFSLCLASVTRHASRQQTIHTHDTYIVKSNVIYASCDTHCEIHCNIPGIPFTRCLRPTLLPCH